MIWKSSVLDAISRLTRRKKNRVFSRQELIEEELDRVAAEVGSAGRTPAQTLSRILQELGREKIIVWKSRGVYRFNR